MMPKCSWYGWPYLVKLDGNLFNQNNYFAEKGGFNNNSSPINRIALGDFFKKKKKIGLNTQVKFYHFGIFPDLNGKDISEW